jgi:hypothetical protein
MTENLILMDWLVFWFEMSEWMNECDVAGEERNSREQAALLIHIHAQCLKLEQVRCGFATEIMRYYLENQENYRYEICRS